MEMPGADGLEVAQFVCNHHFPVTILVISNYDNFEYVTPLLQAGAYDYLLKHEMSRSLIETKLSEIQQHINRHQRHQKQWEQMCQLSKQQYLRNLVLNYEIPEDSRHFFSSDPLPVSYTHLDVYKRQQLAIFIFYEMRTDNLNRIHVSKRAE